MSEYYLMKIRGGRVDGTLLGQAEEAVGWTRANEESLTILQHDQYISTSVKGSIQCIYFFSCAHSIIVTIVQLTRQLMRYYALHICIESCQADCEFLPALWPPSLSHTELQYLQLLGTTWRERAECYYTKVMCAIRESLTYSLTPRYPSSKTPLFMIASFYISMCLL